MTLKLLPVQVPLDSISDPTSRIITPQVINAYISAAGDFMEAVSTLRHASMPVSETPVHSCRTVCCAHEKNSYTRPTTTRLTTTKTKAEVRCPATPFHCPLYVLILFEATACEVLARRVVHQAPPEKIPAIMSMRFRHKEVDGDVRGRISALEMAIDSHW